MEFEALLMLIQAELPSERHAQLQFSEDMLHMREDDLALEHVCAVLAEEDQALTPATHRRLMTLAAERNLPTRYTDGVPAPRASRPPESP